VVLPILVLVALVALVPASLNGSFVKFPPRPGFFAQEDYKRCMARGETLLVFPYARFGDSMLWQAESGFWFKIAEGDLGRDTWPPKFVFADETCKRCSSSTTGPSRDRRCRSSRPTRQAMT
jgi:hypothetical protein